MNVEHGPQAAPPAAGALASAPPAPGAASWAETSPLESAAAIAKVVNVKLFMVDGVELEKKKKVEWIRSLGWN
jgi:hypothetical protein